MVPVVRGAIVLAAVAGGFAGGYFVKNTSTSSTAAAEPPVAVAEARARPKSAGTSVMTSTVMPRTATTRTVERPRTNDLPLAPPSRSDTDPLTIAPPPYPAPQSGDADVVDPSDPAFQMIKRELGIKTSILDRSEPPPAVLVAARKDELPEVVPPPTPMVGPTPKLEPPRIEIDLPRIPDPQPPNPIRLLNSRDIEFDFEVTKVGLSKIRAVELWTTRDGATWQRTDRQEGARSPFRTRLGSEGEYGFRLVFESESGQRTPNPTHSERADLTLILDTTPPRIDIFPPEPVTGTPGQVRLRWAATDRHLDQTYLRIEYSENGKVWHPIGPTTGLRPDSGGFDWTLPPGVPPRVVLRFTVRDKAGNLSSIPTRDSVAIDLVIPEGRLTGVRAPGSEPERGPMPRTIPAGGVARAVPGVLRAALEVLLNSPIHFRDVPGGVGAAGHLFADSPWQSGRDWVRDLTTVHLIPAAPAQADEPADIAAQWYEMAGGYWNEPPRAWRGYMDLPGDSWLHYRRPVREHHMKLAREANKLAGGRSIAHLLSDPDWKPSTAIPESYSTTDLDSATHLPFGGRFDMAPPYWGSVAGPAIRMGF